MFFSRSKAVSLAITLREDDEGLKARFHKPESIFSHRCRRHHHASRCFLGSSLKLKFQSCCLIWLPIYSNYLVVFVTKVLLYVTLLKNSREITCVVLIFC